MNSDNKSKRKRCPRGTRKNRKSGICEPKKINTTQNKISEKEVTPKGQTKLESYYPITRIKKTYKRKPKPPPQIQTKLTQYLKPSYTSK